MKHPWQKNFFKTPSAIMSKIDSIQSKELIIGCVKEIPIKDINEGIYKHLDIFLDNSSIKFAPQIMPNPYSGRYSKYNIHGREIKLKNLPKIDMSYTVSHPNFGDSSRGYSDTTLTRKVWQKQFILPREILINISLIKQTESTYIFKFTLDTLLIKDQPNFEEDLLFYCNLLQENTGICDVFDKDATDESLINTLYVDWDILPVGTSEDTLNILLKKLKNPSPKTIEILKERIDFFKTLEVKSEIYGANSFNRYFGAVLKNDYALFENIRYGNAIYIFKKNWEQLSKMDRIQLQRIKSEDIIRIPHTSNWKKNVLNRIEEVS